MAPSCSAPAAKAVGAVNDPASCTCTFPSRWLAAEILTPQGHQVGYPGPTLLRLPVSSVCWLTLSAEHTSNINSDLIRVFAHQVVIILRTYILPRRV